MPNPHPPHTHLQPMYVWPAECTLDPSLTQAYDELMNQSPTSIYADLLYALKELNLLGEAGGGAVAPSAQSAQWAESQAASGRSCARLRGAAMGRSCSPVLAPALPPLPLWAVRSTARTACPCAYLLQTS